MISIFIFPAESAAYKTMDGLGGLTRFRQKGSFCGFDRSCPSITRVGTGALARTGGAKLRRS